MAVEVKTTLPKAAAPIRPRSIKPLRLWSAPWGNLRSGRRLGVDVGTVRVGLAVSDPDGVLAFPLKTLTIDEKTSVVDQIVAIARENAVMEIVVGLPRHLSGAEGSSAAMARELAVSLRAEGESVRLIDERLTTSTASAALRSSGRDARQQRSVIDQEAARQILQFALDSERTSGRIPGIEP